jgi:hypothetical protein
MPNWGGGVGSDGKYLDRLTQTIPRRDSLGRGGTNFLRKH